MNDLRILSLVNGFPIGEEAKTRQELLSKVEIISYLARYQDQFSAVEDIDERENSVKDYLSYVTLLSEYEQIPSLDLAESNLHISKGFVHDFSNIERIKNSNPSFDETYDTIANSIVQQKNSSKSV